MACLTPIILKSAKGSRDRYTTEKVPCGRCPDCTMSRRAAWVFRLQQEQKHSLTSAFVTYTYDDVNLCWTKKGLATLNKRHHQLYIKRLRTALNDIDQEFPIKYYTVGEYGTKTNRPHLHSIIYNLPKYYIENVDLNNNSHLLQNHWQQGHVRVDPVTPSSIAYVAGYCMKKLAPFEQRPNDDRKPEFSMMSKGLGKQFLTPQTVKFYKNNLHPYIVKEDGKKQIMPRYYKDKIYNDLDKAKIASKVKKYIEENPRFESFKQEYETIEYKHLLRDREIRQKRSKV